MARYDRGFDEYRGYRRDLGGQWNQGGSWQGYDSDFNRGRFQQQGGRFGSGTTGYGRTGQGRGQYGGRGFARRYDEQSYGGAGGYDRGNYGRTDFGTERYGGLWGGEGGSGHLGYSGDDPWGMGPATGRFGRGRESMWDRGMGGRYGEDRFHGRGWNQEYDRDFGGRVREGWEDLKRGMRRTFGGGYDRRG